MTDYSIDVDLIDFDIDTSLAVFRHFSQPNNNDITVNGKVYAFSAFRLGRADNARVSFEYQYDLSDK